MYARMPEYYLSKSSKLDSTYLSTCIIRKGTYSPGFFQPFGEGVLGPFALGNFRYFNQNWENFYNHFYMIFLNRDPKTALNHSYSWLSVADSEGVQGIRSNPPFRQNYFNFMGIFMKI